MSLIQNLFYMRIAGIEDSDPVPDNLAIFVCVQKPRFKKKEKKSEVNNRLQIYVIL